MYAHKHNHTHGGTQSPYHSNFTDTYSKHGEHALADIECMSPIVVQNITIVLPYSQQPPTQGLEKKEWKSEMNGKKKQTE